MVIHDFRNPTSQINFAIGFALDNITKFRKRRDDALTELYEELERSKNLLFEKVGELR